MNSLCITDEESHQKDTLRIPGGFDVDGSVSVEMWPSSLGYERGYEMYLSRAQVAQLRDHLNKLLESSIAQVK